MAEGPGKEHIAAISQLINCLEFLHCTRLARVQCRNSIAAHCRVIRSWWNATFLLKNSVELYCTYSSKALSHCTRGPTISLQCTSSKQKEGWWREKSPIHLAVHVDSRISWNHSGRCAWNRPSGERQAEKRACGQLATPNRRISLGN